MLLAPLVDGVMGLISIAMESPVRIGTPRWAALRPRAAVPVRKSPATVSAHCKYVIRATSIARVRDVARCQKTFALALRQFVAAAHIQHNSRPHAPAFVRRLRLCAVSPQTFCSECTFPIPSD